MKILNEEKHLPFALTNEENVSTKDREIKEMIQEVCPSYPLACKYCMVDEDCGTIEMVAHLYNAGYRKQSEGEDLSEYNGAFECSLCHWSDWDTMTGDTNSYNYCPNCGARMRGENNG